MEKIEKSPYEQRLLIDIKEVRKGNKKKKAACRDNFLFLKNDYYIGSFISDDTCG